MKIAFVLFTITDNLFTLASTKVHYWTQGLCRGPEALGKGSSAVGEGFAEGSPR